MIYMERKPAAPLSQNIRMLWYTCAPDVPHRRERILPNGHIQVILNLARDFILDCPENEKVRPMSPYLIVGARSVYEVVDSSDMADLIGIVFEPGGFPAFAGDAADAFTNRNIALDDVWGGHAKTLRDRLREAPTPEAKLICLEHFLLDRWMGRFMGRQFMGRQFKDRFSRNRVVDFALSRFVQEPALSAVKDVAKETGWSERYFSQMFREAVGFTPKVWCRIQRFQRIVQQLHAGGDVPWVELALDCGYYDQSHFANEFRAFSGVDATSYSARRTQWANHIPEI